MSSATPGVYTGHASTHKVVCLKDPLYSPKPVIVDGTFARDPTNTAEIRNLQPGVILGKITSGGLYAPSIIGLVTADAAGAATHLIVSVATATELVRRRGSNGTFNLNYSIDGTTAVVTVTVAFSAVAISTGDITITAPAGNPAIHTGSILGDLDGSQVAKGIVPDGSGVDVFDIRRATTDDIDAYVPNLLMGGFIRTAGIVNYPTAAHTAFITFLKAQLRAAGGWYVFDDDI